MLLNIESEADYIKNYVFAVIKPIESYVKSLLKKPIMKFYVYGNIEGMQ
jgi:hypothetical protein